MRRPRTSRCLSALSALLAGAAISCAASVPPPSKEPEIPRPPPAPTAAPLPVAPPLLPSQVIASIEDETVAPYFARRGVDEGLLVFSAKGRWMARAIGADGVPKGDAREVSPLASNPTMGALKPVHDGYLLVWAELVAKNAALKVLALDTDGKPRGAAALVTQVTEEVTWLDVLPNKKGALVLWEVPESDRSDLFMAPVSAAGKVEGAPSAVAKGAIGWEAEATERGAALAIVTSQAPGGAKKGRKRPAKTADEIAPRGTKLGRVVLTEIDDKAHAAAPIVVSNDPSSQIDVTLAEVDGKYVVAWTDERNIDASVYVSVVERGGKIAVAPRRATAPFGEQALVSLVAEAYAPGAPRSKRALLAWEDQIRAPRDGRLIHLATIGADGVLAKERAELIFSASGPPDIEPDGEGFAALTLAPVREAPPGVDLRIGPKGDAPVWPSFVRFSKDLNVLASEPVRAAPFRDRDDIPYLTRGLSCVGGKCTTLASGAVIPAKGPEAPAVAAPLALVSLPARDRVWKAPAFRDADEAPPRASSVTALFDGDHLAKVAAAELPGGGAMSAWVTYVVQAIGGGRGKRSRGGAGDEPRGATLGIRAIGADGKPGKPVTLSKSAVSIGGVAVAAAPLLGDKKGEKKAETAIAWIARVRSEPQVFVTKVAANGDKLAEKGVTVISRKAKKKGLPGSEATDVAIAYAGGEGRGGDGWITAWVDTRDGNAEVYVAKVDRALTKVIPDKRITDALGDAAEVQIALRGKDIFLAWSDARAKPEEGSGDIYVARLDAATLKKTGPETRLFASATHSRTPQILATDKGLLVAWIEEGESGRDQGAGLRIAELDDKGALIGAPRLMRAGDGQGSVTSATLGCTRKHCRGVLTSAQGQALVLGAFEMRPGADPGPLKTIAALTGNVDQDASPAFAGPSATSLLFADDAVGGSGRVRWMEIAWP